VTLVYQVPGPALDLPAGSSLVFWLKTRNENIPAWQGANPLLALVDPSGARHELTPQGDFLSAPPYNEAREGWTCFTVPLAGNDDWKASETPVRALRELHFGFDSWGAPPLTIWLDGVTVRPADPRQEPHR